MINMRDPKAQSASCICNKSSIHKRVRPSRYHSSLSIVVATRGMHPLIMLHVIY